MPKLFHLIHPSLPIRIYILQNPALRLHVSPSKSTCSKNTSPAKSISSVQLDTDSDGDNIDDAYIPGSADSQSETENDDASEAPRLPEKVYCV